MRSIPALLAFPLLLLLAGCPDEEPPPPRGVGPGPAPFSVLEEQRFGGMDPYVKGKVDAKKDVEKGLLKVILRGEKPRWVGFYMNLLSKRRIAVSFVGRDTEKDREYDRGYHEVSMAAIEKKHGKGFLDLLKKKAMKQAEEAPKGRIAKDGE